MSYGDDDKYKNEVKRALKEMRDREHKALFKEALKEWLDDQLMKFGRWSFMGVLAMAFAGLVYLFMQSQGWTHK